MRKMFLLAASFAVFMACKNNTQNTNDSVSELSQEEMMVDSHNAENSLDWMGTYKGVIPAASSPGIEVTLTLFDDGTYRKTDVYIDEKDGTFKEEGNFMWSEDGSKVILTLKDGEKQQYKVQEGRVLLLDQEGNEITGELASHYILNKVEE
ncbi:copper resistance protein NlpE [Capnocytophaga sp.]|uniref:copper resistance protein NlpE n=1 Tax=Capnocytophaga sp. TaxID=44737 RepID=UPI0026DBE3B0|nr:copper resistance protein NlpE [Capnocytophaga sp.]MDO5105480.1 copper resistance protein NlpE [Capnocytophaga sp.]